MSISPINFVQWSNSPIDFTRQPISLATISPIDFTHLPISNVNQFFKKILIRFLSPVDLFRLTDSPVTISSIDFTLQSIYFETFSLIDLTRRLISHATVSPMNFVWRPNSSNNITRDDFTEQFHSPRVPWSISLINWFHWFIDWFHRTISLIDWYRRSISIVMIWPIDFTLQLTFFLWQLYEFVG